MRLLNNPAGVRRTLPCLRTHSATFVCSQVTKDSQIAVFQLFLDSGSSTARLTYGVRSSSMRMASCAVRLSQAILVHTGNRAAGWIGYVYGVPCEVMPSEDGEEIKSKSPRWRLQKTITTKYACGHELTNKVEYKNRYYQTGVTSYWSDMKNSSICYSVGFCPNCFELNIREKRKQK